MCSVKGAGKVVSAWRKCTHSAVRSRVVLVSVRVQYSPMPCAALLSDNVYEPQDVRRDGARTGT
jgi:hypothetical protein